MLNNGLYDEKYVSGKLERREGEPTLKALTIRKLRKSRGWRLIVEEEAYGRAGENTKHAR